MVSLAYLSLAQLSLAQLKGKAKGQVRIMVRVAQGSIQLWDLGSIIFGRVRVRQTLRLVFVIVSAWVSYDSHLTRINVSLFILKMNKESLVNSQIYVLRCMANFTKFQFTKNIRSQLYVTTGHKGIDRCRTTRTLYVTTDGQKGIDKCRTTRTLYVTTD